MYLISIYFDEETEKRIRNLIEHVAKATGNSFMLDNQVPPHLTIAAVETKHEDMLVVRVEELVKEFHVGEIEWVSIGSFSSKVMYVQPVLSEYLHDMSAVLSQEFGKMEETIPSPYYQPFHWLPHCTIAKQLSKEQMQKAFQVLQNEFVPMKGCITRIGVAKTNPHRDIKVWELGEL